MIATKSIISNRIALPRRAARKQVTTKAVSDVNAVMSVANLALLSLGRFVFLPYQRRSIAAAGKPMQNNRTHAAAGDMRAEEASFILQTNDPAGFNIIDVMAWGSLGHVTGFLLLAFGSL